MEEASCCTPFAFDRSGIRSRLNRADRARAAGRLATSLGEIWRIRLIARCATGNKSSLCRSALAGMPDQPEPLGRWCQALPAARRPLSARV